MAAPNFTVDGQRKMFEDFTCSRDSTAGLHDHFTFISVLSSFLSVPAILGNALILIALRKESSIHPPSKLLLRNLATTDLCVGLITEPLAFTYLMSVVNEDWTICPHLSVAFLMTSYILCGVSVATLTAISVDRLLALLLGLRYRQVVTLKRTYVTVVAFWVIATVFSSMLVWNPLITFWYGILNISLCLVTSAFSYVTAFLGNALILVALHKESSLHPPSKLLLRSLATTDLCVGLIGEPLAVAYWMSVVNEHWNICPHLSVVGFITSFILCGMSVATMTVISVDRLLALLLGLRYRLVVTLKRTYVIVITLLVNVTVISVMQCWNPLITLWCGIILTPMCLVISIFSYTKIFLILRQRQNQVQVHVQQPSQTYQLNIARYKKAVSTAIWLQLTLVACYLPYSVITVFVTKSEPSSSLFSAWIYACTLVYLNSSLNPILYCWKIEEVRQAVNSDRRQVLCHFFSS